MSSHLWKIYPLALCIAVVAGQRPQDVTDPDQVPNVIYFNTANFYAGSGARKSIQLQNLETVFQHLHWYTPEAGFATCLGYGDEPNTIFAHTACYAGACSDCIKDSYNRIRDRATNDSMPIGFRLWTNTSVYKCNARYEIVNFTRSLPPDTLGILVPNVSEVTPRSVPGNSSANKTTIAGAATGGSLLVILVISGIFVFFYKRSRKPPGDELQGATRAPIGFSYRELSSATGNFSEKNKLGQGGFGPVFKAVLGDGTHVAVKKHSTKSQQGKKEFVNEISIITGIQHKNLVKLIGYCAETKHRLLVYEFLENNSLDRLLFGGHEHEILAWGTRFQIVLGVAKGLAYLHEESHVQIIHRDIKASNILLDKVLQPKISDFGLSMLHEETSDHDTSRLAGTFGYMAPEYVTEGRLSTKADVFSFGVLVLEVLSGRKSIDSSDGEVLVQKIWRLHKAGVPEELIDKRLHSDYVAEEAHRLVHVAMLCTQESPEHRPAMSAVVSMLSGHPDVQPLVMLQAPRYFSQGWSDSSSKPTTVPVQTISYVDEELTTLIAR